MIKYIEARISNGILEVMLNNIWMGAGLSCNETDLLEIKENKKDRVKQAIRLKESGFNGSEVIEIIGEIK